jgi:hypothetical protein
MQLVTTELATTSNTRIDRVAFLQCKNMVVQCGPWFKSTPTVLAIWLPVVAYAVRNLQIQTSAQFFTVSLSKLEIYGLLIIFNS